MADISFGGLASGLPTDDIVSQLMEVERIPVDSLEEQKTSEATRLKAYGQLDSRLEALRDAVGDMNISSEVRSSSISLSSEDAFTATSSGAGSGTYDVTVVQLAQVQKSISSGWDSNTEALLGTGTFTVGDETITIDESNNSLLGLVGEINELSETTGVHASVINDGSEDGAYHLVLTGADASTSFSTSASLTDSEGAALDFTLNQTRAAQQAVAFVDGIKVVSDTNTLTGIIPGVTMNLSEASTMTSAGVAEDGKESWEWAEPPEYESTTMTVAPDTDALKEKVQTFVSSYNAVMDWISAGYDEFGATSDEASDDGEELLSSELRGDSTVNSVKRKLQDALTSVIDTSGSLKVLSQLGISTQSDGSIDLDETALDEALQSDFEGVVGLLAGEDEVDGVMKKFNSTLLAMTSPTQGMYAIKEDSYNSAVDRLDDKIERMEAMLEKREATLLSQFSAMELLVSSMNSQSSYLTQQFDMLSNMMTGD